MAQLQAPQLEQPLYSHALAVTFLSSLSSAPSIPHSWRLPCGPLPCSAPVLIQLLEAGILPYSKDEEVDQSFFLSFAPFLLTANIYGLK